MRYQHLKNEPRNVVLATCKKDGAAYKYASMHRRGDYDIAMAAVNNCGMALEFAPFKMRKDRDVVLMACSNDGHALQFAAPTLQEDEQVVLEACLSTEGTALQFANEKLQSNRHFLWQVIGDNGGWRALDFATTELRRDKDLLTARDGARWGAPVELRNDEHFVRDVLLTKCKEDPSLYREFSEHFRANEKIAAVAASADGTILQFAPPNIQNDRSIVLLACSQNGLALEHSTQRLQGDKEVVMVACSQNGHALQYASSHLRKDQEVVMEACHSTVGSVYCCGSALQFADKSLQSNTSLAKKIFDKGGWQALRFCDRDVVLEECKKNGTAYRDASDLHKTDREIALAALSSCGSALEWAPREVQNDREAVMVACTQDGHALKFAHRKLRNDKEIVSAACAENCLALEYAGCKLRNDKGIVLAACSNKGIVLKFASQSLQNDKEVVLVACSKDGRALAHASKQLREDKEVVMTDAESNPESLKFALAGLNQDRDCLIKAKLWDKDYTTDVTTRRSKRKIVLSTKFSLAADSSAHATRFAVELKRHPYIACGDFLVYSPNAFAKGTCDPDWTNKAWPCRGTYLSCQKPPMYKTGVPQGAECCWRYSFRYHIRQAALSGGFMIQVIDKLDPSKGGICNYTGSLYLNHTLGDGQAIETGMAQHEGIKIFRFFEPLQTGQKAYPNQVDRLVSEIQKWYKDGCIDGAELNIRNAAVT